MNRLVLLLTLVSWSLAAINSPCQKGGEYCLNHWDCCSNTCLSFLYKCSHIISSDIKQLDSPPALSSPDLSSRVSFDSPVLAPEGPEVVSYEALLDTIFNPGKSQPAATGREINSIIPRFGEPAAATIVAEEFKNVGVTNPTTTDVPQCLEIGSKCYANEDCCSIRCHGYLHKCVT